MRTQKTSTAIRRIVVASAAIAAVMTISVPVSASASPALRGCGRMHVQALRASGYRTERLLVATRLSCATGRSSVRRYYTSHSPCQGSGCFRVIDNLNCGGGQSSILGGVALLCTRRNDPSAVMIELRVPPKPPPPSLYTVVRAQAGSGSRSAARYSALASRL